MDMLVATRGAAAQGAESLPVGQNVGVAASADLLPGKGERGLVSAIVPTFNRSELVLDALESLVRQTHRQVQIVVVDDGSTDDTQAVLHRWSARHPDFQIDIIHQENRGVAAARNAGLRIAEGEFIYFLDSDDLAHPFAFAELIEALHAYRRAPFAVGHVRNCDLAGNTITWEHVCTTQLSQQNWFGNHWMTNAALYRRSALQRSGLFNERLSGVGEERELGWRIVAAGGTGVIVDKVVGVRRHHDFGHISLNPQWAADEDRLRFVRSAINARAAFAEWIEANGLLRQKMRLASTLHFVELGIRAGRGGDDALRRTAFSLPRRLFKPTPLANIFVSLIGAPRSRKYYSATFFVFRVLRRTRAMLLSVARRLIRA